jgi:hypothetical protein
MNTEDQLRHAAEEMDRATASLTPPPIADVRRGARMRAAGVAVAAAVGVAVLVGGAVLLLRPLGETTLAPSGQGETTVDVETTVTGLVPNDAIQLADLDAEPRFDLAGAREMPLLDIGSEELALDIAQLRLEADPEALDRLLQFLVLGASDVDHVYVVKGIRASEADIGGGFDCLFTGSGADWRELWCGDDNSRGIDPSVSRLGDVPYVAVTGRAPQGSSVVVLELGDDRYWQRTRDGFVHLAVAASDDDPARFFVYDSAGNVLDGWTFYDPSGPGSEVTDTTAAVAAEDDGSCSGGLFFPDTTAFGSLPESVRQTLGQITLFGSRCWFEDLAAVGGDNFTASFGGMDPVELWTFEEAEGYAPMHHLMQILDMPHGTGEVDGRRLYIWPAAAAHDGDWDTVPLEDKNALRNLYDDEDFAGFESFGAYIGYRVGIYEDGDWSFFVAGD